MDRPQSFAVHRRALLAAGLGAAASAVVPRLRAQEPFPSRPIKILVGAGAGGTTDITARLVGQQLTKVAAIQQLRIGAFRQRLTALLSPQLQGGADVLERGGRYRPEQLGQVGAAKCPDEARFHRLVESRLDPKAE